MNAPATGDSAERRYRAYGLTPYLWAEGLVAFAVVGAPLVVVSVMRTGEPPLWFAAAWIGFVAFLAWQALFRVAVEIHLGADGISRFRTIAQKTADEVALEDIVSVNPFGRFGDANVVVVRHQRGKARVIQPIDGMHDFLARVKEANPSVEIRGL